MVLSLHTESRDSCVVVWLLVSFTMTRHCTVVESGGIQASSRRCLILSCIYLRWLQVSSQSLFSLSNISVEACRVLSVNFL